MPKYSPKRLAGLKTMPKLPEGQKTTAVRVSGGAEVIDWAAGLTPAERGRIFQHAYESSLHAYACHQNEPHAYASQVQAYASQKNDVQALTPVIPQLSTAQAQILGALKLPQAVADFDHYEKRWMLGHARAPVKLSDLEELAAAGRLTVTGTGLGAVYSLPPAPVTSQPQQPRGKLKPAEQLALQQIEAGAVVSRDSAGYVLTKGGNVVTTVKRETLRRLVEAGLVKPPAE